MAAKGMHLTLLILFIHKGKNPTFLFVAELESPAHDCSLLISIPPNTENPPEALVILQKLESFKLGCKLTPSGCRKSLLPNRDLICPRTR